MSQTGWMFRGYRAYAAAFSEVEVSTTWTGAGGFRPRIRAAKSGYAAQNGVNWGHEFRSPITGPTGASLMVMIK